MIFFTALVDLVLPPRTSEKLVRGLTLDNLYRLVLSQSGALPYHDPRVTALIWELKYWANRKALALAGEFLGSQVLGIAGEELGKPLLIPVPMHQKRREKRGHNQTELLSEAILSALHSLGEVGQPNVVDYVPLALKRIVDTQPQQGLERIKRLHNVRDSMEGNPHMVEKRICIVVDDVTTTGATLEEARRALLHAGARRVHTITLAQS